MAKTGIIDTMNLDSSRDREYSPIDTLSLDFGKDVG
jgi:hypothetical protein